ncbi:LysR family transcriptional regulator [Neisseriaceae bacterium JH1-16]|nr:LysR family transcriptional regulator [Neisseriaceae bacterium JH1-16]
MNLHRLDLNLLKSLDVLLAERNVTRAASRLNLSQPALSSQLKQLRALFGDPLLLPGSRGMIPTSRALALQDTLREHLSQLLALVAEQQNFDPATAELAFRIVASDAIHRVVAPELLRRLQAAAPRCRLALLQHNLATLSEQMSAGEIDLALLTPAALPDRLKTRILYEETFLCLLRKDHPAAGQPLDLEGFCALEHLIVSPAGGGFWGAVDDALAALGRRRRASCSRPN